MTYEFAEKNPKIIEKIPHKPLRRFSTALKVVEKMEIEEPKSNLTINSVHSVDITKISPRVGGPV